MSVQTLVLRAQARDTAAGRDAGRSTHVSLTSAGARHSRMAVASPPGAGRTPSLQHDNPVRGGETSAPDHAKHGSAIERKQWPERLPVSIQGPAVQRGVRYHQDQHIDSPVSLFERQPPGKCLQIEQPGLGLTGSEPTVQSNHRVPRTPITLDRQRHLDVPPSAWRQPGPEALEERDMTGVPGWIAIRIGPHDQAKADRHRRAGCLVNGQRPVCRPLDSANLRVGHARRRGDHPLAHPGGKARGPDLGTNPTTTLCRCLASLPAGITTSAHSSIMPAGAYLRLPAPCLGAAQPLGGRRTLSVVAAALPTLTARTWNASRSNRPQPEHVERQPFHSAVRVGPIALPRGPDERLDRLLCLEVLRIPP
jgi:hypothetical protein